jgi:hypothetical protein
LLDGVLELDLEKKDRNQFAKLAAGASGFGQRDRELIDSPLLPAS